MPTASPLERIEMHQSRLMMENIRFEQEGSQSSNWQQLYQPKQGLELASDCQP